MRDLSEGEFRLRFEGSLDAQFRGKPSALMREASVVVHMPRSAAAQSEEDAAKLESYDRHIQSAINIQGRKMQCRADFLLTRALRQAGWK